MAMDSMAGNGNLQLTATAVKTSCSTNVPVKYKLLITAFALMPIADTVNGALLKGGASTLLSVGVLYRFALLALCVFYILGNINKRYLVALLFYSAVGLFSVIMHSVLGLCDSIGGDLNEMLLFLMTPLLAFTLLSLPCEREERASIIDRILDNLQVVAPLTILIPYALGLGYSTYSTSGGGFVGYKAFYYATNGITLMLISLFARSAYVFFREKNVKPGIVLILNLAALFLIGTKSALLMLAVSFLLALYCVYGKRLFSLSLRVVCVLVVAAVVGYLLSDVISQHLNPILNRWNYFYGTVYQGDLIAALTSGRTGRIAQHAALMQTSPSDLVSFLFGIGDTAGILSICEMDYFDVFFEFGFFGLLFLIVFIVFCLKLFTGKRTNSFFLLLTLFFLVYALVVGHVFNNAMSSAILALFLVRGALDAQETSISVVK